jgi:uncharacterized membrane protein YoaK (UPF0700 family)
MEARPLPRDLVFALLALTFGAGLLDAVGFLGLGQVFIANQTGTVLLLGFAAAGAGGLDVLGLGTSLAGYLVGALIGGRIATGGMGPQARWFAVSLGLETGLVAAAAAVVILGPGAGAEPVRYLVIALLGVAMGLRAATILRLGISDITTTVVSRVLAALAADSSLAGGKNVEALPRLGGVVALVAGAAVGAVLVGIEVWLALAVMVVLVPLTGGLYLHPARRHLAAQR